VIRRLLRRLAEWVTDDPSPSDPSPAFIKGKVSRSIIEGNDVQFGGKPGPTTFYSDHDGETMFMLAGHFVINHDDVVLMKCHVLSLAANGRNVTVSHCNVGTLEPPWDPDDLPSTADPGVVTDPTRED
jgi:hypothetical protein